MFGKKQINALTVIDEILRLLSQEGLGREVVCSFKDANPTWLKDTELRKLLGIEQMTTRPTDWKITVGICIKEALYLTRSVLEVLNDAIPKFRYFPIEDQLGLYVQARMWASNKFLCYSKYITVWPFAKYLHQLLPEKPEGFPCHPLVFSGSVRRVLKARLVSKNDTNARLFWGYLQGVKRACARANDSDIFRAYVKHRSTLMKTPGTNQCDIINHLGPVVDRSLKSFKPPKKPKLYEASTNASVERPRGSGGARSWIREEISAGRLRSEIYDLPRKIETGDKAVVGCAVVKDTAIIEEGSFEEGTFSLTTQPGIIKKVYGQVPPSFDEVLDLAYRQYNFQHFGADPPDVVVQAVLEPLKIRLISKGNALNYYTSKFYQKAMWGYLQKFPQFVLTGRTVDTSDLYGLILLEKKLDLHSFDKWVSGDYSSATDNVNRFATELIFERMLKKSPYGGRLKDVLRSAIYPQKINYPTKPKNSEDKEWNDDLLKSFVQSNGQLMGSPLSFPILCLINLVCYWISLEEYTGRKFEMEDLPVLINGDDILFRANDQFYEIWKKWVKFVGFELSLGKNYIHKDYLTINSKLFRYQSKSQSFKSLGYLNVGLLTGQAKIKSDGTVKTLWDMYNICIGGCINPSRTKKRFFHYQKDQIAQATKDGNFNCYAARERGGLGFDLYQGQGNHFTLFQRRFATLIEEKIQEAINTENALKIKNCIDACGIINENAGPKPLLHERSAKVNLMPKIGCLDFRIIPFEVDEYDGPILANERVKEAPSLRVKVPRDLIRSGKLDSKNSFRKLREGVELVPLMSKKKMTNFNHQFCELEYTKKVFLSAEEPEIVAAMLSQPLLWTVV